MSAITPFDRTNIELFTPDQIPNLSLWLDANDTNTITVSGNNVTQWRDKSSNAHICISNANYAGTTLPTFCNVNPRCVNFAPNQALVTSGAWNYTTSWSCFVAINSVLIAPRWLISPYNSVNPVLMGMSNGTNKIFPNAFNSVPADITGQHIEYTSAENTSANSNLLWFRDGVQQASNVRSLGAGANPNARMGIGANATINNAMAGTYQLYEVLIYNKYLSPTERQQVESYLAYKWNLRTNLPTNQPFFNSPFVSYYGLNIPSVNLTNTLSRFPSEIPNLQLWLDAADSSSVITSGNAVTQWSDKSGNGRHMISNASYQNPTYALNSLNGNNSIAFSRIASNSFTILENTSFNFVTPSWTYFIIVRRNAANTTFQRFTSMATTINGLDNNNAASFNLNSYNTNNMFTMERNSAIFNGTFNTTNLCLLENIVNGGGSNIDNFIANTNYLFTNGSLLASAGGLSVGTSLNIAHVRFGSATFRAATNDSGFESLQGNIGEVLLFNRTLRQSELQQVEAYLTWKWGIQSNLPSSHPAFIPPVPVPIPRTITNYIFSPLIFSGLSVWLDGSDLNSLSLSGSNITQWRDKSGNSRNANISGTVSFSNSNIITNGTSPNSFSVPLDIRRTTLSNLNIFIVYNQQNITTPVDQGLYGNDVNGGWNRFQLLNNTIGLNYRLSAGSSQSITVSNINNTNKHIYNASYSLSNNSFVYLNGSVNATFTEYASQIETTNTNIFFGTINNSVYYGNLIFNEIILFNRSLSTNERQQIEGYLAWKYGLQANLPSSHPFRIFPPG